MEAQKKHTNRLIYSESPYLLQHAYNPVDWFPWSEEAFKKAREENKLLLVSIGYSSCHWCHVMEHESFSDPEVAKVMNENFVSIKVDREERPDVDNIYMDAVQLITGRGGWPLNCFILPDGKPVYGGTYFPKEQWLELLNNLAGIHKDEPQKLTDQAEKIAEGVSQIQYIPQAVTGEDSFGMDELNNYINRIKSLLDQESGGLKGAPKFPMPQLHRSLVKYNFYFRDEEINQYLHTTLKRMAQGGIFDQLYGGFARYSTDKDWLVPHFEKMLYDNAQLASLYSEAYLMSKEEDYLDVIHQTLEFIQKTFMTQEYGFFSALDADTEGKEGHYYTWSKSEVERIFLHNSDVICDYFGIDDRGELDGRNVLHRNKSESELAKKYGISADKINSIIGDAKKVLLKKRSTRQEPDLDNKVIVSWNALTINAFLDGYRATKKKDYLRIALNSAEFLVTNQLQNDYRLNRIFINGKSSVNAFLDDYALLIEAFINLYQVTFDDKWIDWAYKLTKYVQEHFKSPNSALLKYKSDLDTQLIASKIEIMDTVIPSSNAVMAKNLFILGQYFYSNSFIRQSKEMVNQLRNSINQAPPYFSRWLDLFMWFIFPPYEIAIVGKKSEEYKERFTYIYHPGIILAGGTHEGNMPILRKRFKLGQTKIYICQEQVCQEPLNNVEEAIKKIS